MKFKKLNSIIAIALGAQTAAAQTTYTGPVMDLFDDSATTNTNAANWTNGTPGAGNDGTIAIDYDFSTFGAADNGNVNPLPIGAFSVTQTAGNGTGGQFNLVGNPDFTFNLNGGTLDSSSGTFFVNTHSFNIGGGALTTANQARLRGPFTISSGSFTTPNLDLEQNTVLTQTGGTITTTSGIAINQSATGGKTVNFMGGTFFNSTAASLITNLNVSVSIGGDFVFDAALATGLFNNTGGSSTIDFAADWSGSLILDSATAWDDVFEAEGRVSVGGVVVGADNFETFFENNSGVITLALSEPAETAKWTGLGGSTWDLSTTANFAINDPADPLNNVTFDTFASSPLSVAIFDDTYESNGGSTPVATAIVDVAAGGVSGASVSFTNDSTPYEVSSADINGISGSGNVSIEGSSSVTLLGTHAYTGTTTIEAGTLNLGDSTTDGSIVDSTITNNAALVVTNSADLTHNQPIGGDGSFEKLGAGAFTFAGNYANLGSVTVSEGILAFQGVMRASSYDIAASSILEIDGAFNNATDDTTFTGDGILSKTGPGEVRWGVSQAEFALGSDAIIEVLAGTLKAASNGNVAASREVWTDNLSDLDVASGATFQGSEGNIRVDVLTGDGAITSGGNPATTGYTGFTFGVDNGSGEFDGRLQNDPGIFTGNFVKVGTGTQTLSGINTYTGNTTIEEGVLTLSSSGEITAAPGANGVSNVIQGSSGGSGVINLDGALVVEITEDAELINGNSWLLVDDTDLTVNYGSTFSVALFDGQFSTFSETAGVWTFVDGDNSWTFSEATGILSLVNSNEGTITITDCGLTETGDFFIDVAEGVTGLTVTTSPDLSTAFEPATGVTDDGANRFTIDSGSVDINGDGADFFRVESE